MKTAEEWFQEGLKHLELSTHADYGSEYRGDLESAADAFAQCVALDTSHVDALRLRGFTLQKLSLPTEALDCLVTAATLAPEDAELLRSAGECLAELKQWEKAVSLFERVLKLSPGDAEALVGLGNALFELGDHERAATTLDVAVKTIEPGAIRALSIPWLRMRRALCIARAGSATARETFEKVFAEEADRLHSPSSPGEFPLALADFEDARDAYRSWVDKHRDDPSVLVRAANSWSAAAAIHDSAELKKVALAAWDAALAANPKNPYVWREKGEAHAAVGELERAVHHFSEALQLDPDSIAASRRLRDTQRALEQRKRSEGPWKVMGRDTFAREDFVVGTWATLAEAQRELEVREKRAEANTTDVSLRDEYWLVKA
ncbi:MAG: tetratricopeptide repeat protein [Archangium sp.]